MKERENIIKCDGEDECLNIIIGLFPWKQVSSKM